MQILQNLIIFFKSQNACNRKDLLYRQTLHSTVNMDPEIITDLVL